MAVADEGLRLEVIFINFNALDGFICKVWVLRDLEENGRKLIDWVIDINVTHPFCVHFKDLAVADSADFVRGNDHPFSEGGIPRLNFNSWLPCSEGESLFVLN